MYQSRRAPDSLSGFASPFPDAAPRQRALVRWEGLGANTSGDATAGAATGTAIGVGAAALTGAAAGSVVPVLGTAIGAVIGLAVGLLGGGGNKEAGGINNPKFVAITNKWYFWYLGRPTDPSGASWWPGQMQADGLPNAWKNFSTSKEPVAAGVAQRAAQYQQMGYGAPTDPPPVGTNPLIAPPLTMTYAQYAASSAGAQPAAYNPLLDPNATPQEIANATPAQVAAASAASSPLIAGMAPNTLLLLVGAAVLGTALFSRRSSPARSA